MRDMINKLESRQMLSKDEFACLIKNRTPMDEEYLFQRARQVREKHYGNKIYIRGLIEISGYCKRNCFYCGIRSGNVKAQRYRLTKEQILDCAKEGYNLGFRTFVLQGGEDPHFTTQRLVEIVLALKEGYPDCAVTLSVGEKEKDEYKALKNAGADRFLLRHETANTQHYSKLHPAPSSLENRQKCLWQLKELGYQVGTGFMVGSPYQKAEYIIEDLSFIHQLQPEMIGIGPYISHKDTPFKDCADGSVKDTVFLLAVLRLMIPWVLLPATTALATLDDMGMEKGFMAGANVVMPNLSPPDAKEKYMLYNNKKISGSQSGETLEQLKSTASMLGYEVVCHRGDVKKKT